MQVKKQKEEEDWKERKKEEEKGKEKRKKERTKEKEENLKSILPVVQLRKIDVYPDVLAEEPSLKKTNRKEKKKRDRRFEKKFLSGAEEETKIASFKVHGQNYNSRSSRYTRVRVYVHLTSQDISSTRVSATPALPPS